MNTACLKKLNIGDVVYYFKNGALYSRFEIDSVTSKYAFSGKVKFHREYASATRILMVGRTISCYMATPEFDERWERGVLVQKIKTTNFWVLPTKTLLAIEKIIKEV